MMKILWGVSEDCYYYLDQEFIHAYEDSWFDNELVKKILADIDDCEFRNGSCFSLSDDYSFPVSGLSTGSKGLILLAMLEYESIHVWGTAFGDNCSPWLLKIAETRNFTLDLEHFLKFPEEQFKAYSCHSKRDFYDYDDYKQEVLDYGYLSWATDTFEPEEGYDD